MSWTTNSGRLTVILVNKDLTAGQRSFVELFLGTVPAVPVGFYGGLLASDIGPPQDPEPFCILIRGLICAAIPAFLTFIAPRVWFFLSCAYGFGFYYGYTFSDQYSALAVALVALPFAPLALLGFPLGRPPEPHHPELLWIFAFALWLSAFSSLLNRIRRDPR